MFLKVEKIWIHKYISCVIKGFNNKPYYKPQIYNWEKIF